jgi:hypothetical protein
MGDQVKCRWCGGDHAGEACPKVAEIEYYPTGQVKRVVFKDGGEQSFDPPRLNVLKPKVLEG